MSNSNSTPTPQLDLVQMLLGFTNNANGVDPDTTQSVINDFEAPPGETVTLSDGVAASTLTAPYDYDDSGHSLWGFAQYA